MALLHLTILFSDQQKFDAVLKIKRDQGLVFFLDEIDLCTNKTALQIAASNNAFRMAIHLIANGANWQQVSRQHPISPSHIAIERRHELIIQALEFLGGVSSNSGCLPTRFTKLFSSTQTLEGTLPRPIKPNIRVLQVLFFAALQANKANIAITLIKKNASGKFSGEIIGSLKGALPYIRQKTDLDPLQQAEFNELESLLTRKLAQHGIEYTVETKDEKAANQSEINADYLKAALKNFDCLAISKCLSTEYFEGEISFDPEDLPWALFLDPTAEQKIYKQVQELIVNKNWGILTRFEQSGYTVASHIYHTVSNKLWNNFKNLKNLLDYQPYKNCWEKAFSVIYNFVEQDWNAVTGLTPKQFKLKQEKLTRLIESIKTAQKTHQKTLVAPKKLGAEHKPYQPAKLTLAKLPNVVTGFMSKHLTPEDICKLARTCKTFRDLEQKGVLDSMREHEYAKYLLNLNNLSEDHAKRAMALNLQLEEKIQQSEQSCDYTRNVCLPRGTKNFLRWGVIVSGLFIACRAAATKGDFVDFDWIMLVVIFGLSLFVSVANESCKQESDYNFYKTDALPKNMAAETKSLISSSMIDEMHIVDIQRELQFKTQAHPQDKILIKDLLGPVKQPLDPQKLKSKTPSEDKQFLAPTPARIIATINTEMPELEVVVDPKPTKSKNNAVELAGFDSLRAPLLPR